MCERERESEWDPIGVNKPEGLETMCTALVHLKDAHEGGG